MIRFTERLRLQRNDNYKRPAIRGLKNSSVFCSNEKTEYSNILLLFKQIFSFKCWEYNKVAFLPSSCSIFLFRFYVFPKRPFRRIRHHQGNDKNKWDDIPILNFHFFSCGVLLRPYVSQLINQLSIPSALAQLPAQKTYLLLPKIGRCAWIRHFLKSRICDIK